MKLNHQRVIHISRAKRLLHDQPAPIEPPLGVGLLWALAVAEPARAVLVEADLRADMAIGDPGLRVLRKAAYVLEHARQAFVDERHRQELIVYIVETIRDYGEPLGARLLERAFYWHGELPGVRGAIVEAVARIGLPDDTYLLAELARRYPAEQSAVDRAWRQLEDRFPSAFEGEL